MIEQLGIQLDWQSATIQDFPILKEGDLHLWWLPLTLSTQESERALLLLSDIQRDKYHRRMTPELKHAYLAGRHYLLTLLGGYNDCAAEEVKLSYSRLNKPYLSDKGSELEFNFTDTEDGDHYYALFGFSRAKAVGVDIENRSRMIDMTKLIAQRFTQPEQEFVSPNGTIDQARGLSVWTRKEAYGKATGQGINFKMNEQNLVIESTESATNAFNFSDNDGKLWRCIPLNLGSNFVATCVHSGHDSLSVSAFNQLSIEST
jgi:4'-phosphopantetheinyl transferase